MGNSILGQQVGLRIRALRTARNWSQKNLAEKIHVNKSVISYYELGERFPTYDVLLNLASTFHVTTDYLLKGEQGQTINASGLSDEEYSSIATIVDALKRKRGEP